MIGKIKLSIQNRLVDKWIIRTSSSNMFYIMFLGLLVHMLLLKSKILSEILLVLFCIIFVMRICFRWKHLRNLEYYKINEENQKEDMLMRSYQLGDLVAGIMYALFICLFYSNSNNVFNNVFGMTFFIMLYFGVASISISTQKFNTSCKVITVFLSTIQGTFIVLFGFCLILEGIVNVIKIMQTSSLNNRPIEEFLKLFDYKNIMAFSYFIKEYNNWIMIMTVISTIISILLYIILIETIPAYQLDKLSFAFKIASTIIVIGGIAIYLYGNMIYPYMQQYANEIKNNHQLFYEYFGKDAPEELQNFIQNYSKAEITNLGYLLFLPYTIALLISNLLIEFIKNKNTKKANLALDKIFEICENKSNNNTVINDKEIEIFEKRFCYYGGDKHKMKLVRKTYGLKI